MSRFLFGEDGGDRICSRVKRGNRWIVDFVQCARKSSRGHAAFRAAPGRGAVGGYEL
jgi:hypothetical protein